MVRRKKITEDQVRATILTNIFDKKVILAFLSFGGILCGAFVSWKVNSTSVKVEQTAARQDTAIIKQQSMAVADSSWKTYRVRKDSISDAKSERQHREDSMEFAKLNLRIDSLMSILLNKNKLKVAHH